MIRVYDHGSTYGISIGAQELWAFCLGRPGSGLEQIKGLRVRFERETGRRIELFIKGECDATKVDADALTALVNGMRDLAEAKLGIHRDP